MFAPVRPLVPDPKDAAPAWGLRGGKGFTKVRSGKPTMLVRLAAETLYTGSTKFYGHYGISEPRRFRGNAQ